MVERETKRKPRRVFLFLRYVILIVVVGVGVWLINAYVGAKGKVSYEAPTPLVVTGKPRYDNIARKVTLSAHIEAEAMIPVVSLVGGTVVDYPVEVGASVREGDVIARIDDEPYILQARQAEAAYLACESTFKRVEALYQGKNTTEQNYDQVKAQRDAAKAQYDLAVIQQGYATVRAKASGTILTAPTAKGSTVAQGTPVAVIADLGNLVVNLKVPEKEYGIFQEDRDSVRVSVERPADHARCRAEVVSIDPYIQAQSKVFTVKCRLVGDVGAFRPGMYVRATVEYDRHDCVPTLRQTVRKADGSCYLYDGATGTVRHVDFEPEIEDDELFMVPEGYKDSVFVTDGQNSVFDGQAVRLKTSE